ncbi:NUDIX hydrolase [Paenibacillus alkalitolerans]|uniref:NUDIX hydrolase n=1 Tax=Paenibacillus alkalitolerans TaxID=2799335 RepID=UPI0018F2FAD7|nr:8-oxo-dGTP diphosphatase [Paenibacillus alkalitolerans]
MLKYTICYIKQADKILLLNREYPSWMGVWNGVGGKLEPNETARESILREVTEETGIVLDSIQFKGIGTWYINGKVIGGMYTYFAELPPDFLYETPIKTTEGILDWKDIQWILHPENRGVVNNIPRSIERIIHEPACFEHRCFYEDGRLVHDEFFET